MKKLYYFLAMAALTATSGMALRVIAGSARRLRLKTPEGTNTRPTTDRIKETLFNILQPHVEGCVFLDLFSGSGGIGIEALSRGAKKAYFVEHNREAAKLIRENLEFTRLSQGAVVLDNFPGAFPGPPVPASRYFLPKPSYTSSRPLWPGVR